MRTWAVAALDLIFPALCPVCRGALGAGRRDPLCGACWGGVLRIGAPHCDCCGAPFAGFAPPAPAAAPGGGARCAACAAEPPDFAYARAGGVYAGPLRDALHAFKFGGRRALARPLADLVLEQCRGALAPDPAALIPVPLARERERARGFNQAALLAERLALGLGVPARGRWLVRLRATGPQSDLPADARRANVRHAFGASAAVAGLHVVLVDDILTTGATAGECARALRAAGARQVGVLAVARVL